MSTTGIDELVTAPEEKRPAAQTIAALFSFPEKPHHERQDNADNDAGGEGKIEGEVRLLNDDVPWEPAKKSLASDLPKKQAGPGQDQPDNEKRLTNFLHTKGSSPSKRKSRWIQSLKRASSGDNCRMTNAPREFHKPAGALQRPVRC